MPERLCYNCACAQSNHPNKWCSIFVPSLLEELPSDLENENEEVGEDDDDN